jgi:hypothetical protein
MNTVLVSYDGRNKVVSGIMESLALMKGVSIDFNFKAKPRKNGLDEAIDDIKNGRIIKCKNFEEYKRETDKMLGYV